MLILKSMRVFLKLGRLFVRKGVGGVVRGRMMMRGGGMGRVMVGGLKSNVFILYSGGRCSVFCIGIF